MPPQHNLFHRFFAKIQVMPNGCWLWTRARALNGYGFFSIKGRNVLAHRVSYALATGTMPPNLTIDHLCRNRLCVNPAHLEAVTNQTNLLRGNGICAQNARRTHCVHGHPFDLVNTNFRPNGGRACKVCRLLRGRRWRQGKKVAVKVVKDDE